MSAAIQQGKLYTWGNDAGRRLGHPSPGKVATPTVIKALADVPMIQVAVVSHKDPPFFLLCFRVSCLALPVLPVLPVLLEPAMADVGVGLGPTCQIKSNKIKWLLISDPFPSYPPSALLSPH